MKIVPVRKVMRFLSSHTTPPVSAVHSDFVLSTECNLVSGEWETVWELKIGLEVYETCRGPDFEQGVVWGGIAVGLGVWDHGAGDRRRIVMHRFWVFFGCVCFPIKAGIPQKIRI